MRFRHSLLALAATGLLAGACTSGNGANGRANGGDLGNIKLIAALQPFDACDDFLSWVKKEATDRVTAYGLPGSGSMYGGVARGAMEDSLAPAGAATASGGAVKQAATDAAAAAPSPSATPGFSTTNVVEAGVDEPDLVKTDGKRIVTLVNNVLRIIDVTGGAPRELGSLTLPNVGYADQLLLSGDKVLVLGQEGGLVWRDGKVAAIATDGSDTRDDDVWLPSATLTEIDLADPAHPHQIATLRVEGSYLNARMVGSTARIVLQSSPSKLEFVSPSGPTSEARAVRSNREVIDESTADQWLPSYLLEAGGKTSQGRLVDCSRVHHPATFSGFSTLSVLTVDLAKALTPGDGVGVLADGQQVYASPDNLYVAVNRYEDPASPSKGGAASKPIPPQDANYTTTIHKFSIKGSAPAAYLASGTVRGHLMNDFSLSEAGGNLRVATTDGPPWGMPMPTVAVPDAVAPSPNAGVAASKVAVSPPAGPPVEQAQSESFVTVLAQQDRQLTQIGQVGGLGKGERIYGVRFLGDVGYVVTFRQTDPLYVVDLRNPAAPAVRGELKIPGYSAYLHPLADGRLLGVGQDATDKGRATGLQVALFDVSDPSSPRQVAKLTVPQGWSDGEHDYHAFLWWPTTKLAALPLQSYGENGPAFSGLLGLTVDGDSITEKGRIAHPIPGAGDPCRGGIVPAQESSVGVGPAKSTASGSTSAGVASLPSIAPMPCPDYFVPPAIQRSLVVGDTLYTLSPVGLMASSLTDLSSRGWLAFPISGG